MGEDLPIVFGWWVTVWVFGAAAFPLVRRGFGKWFDQGYFLSKAVGLMLVTFGVWWLAALHVLAFSWVSILAVTIGVGAIGLYKASGWKDVPIKTIVAEELFFVAMLWLWVWVKGHEPHIHGLEKFMDFGFAKSILTSTWLPAGDMWYKGLPINYYYFGHTMMAVVSKFSGIDLRYGFNLMLCTLFAFTSTMSFGIVFQLLANLPKNWRLSGAVLAAFLVSLGGNLHTIYAFTIGYDGEHPVPFWEIFSDKNAAVQPTLEQRFAKYWYPNATRFIPFTIHEFPSYSFTVSDVHGHVLSLGLVLLALVILIELFAYGRESPWLYGLYGLTVAAAFTTNASDGPIYLGLFVVFLVLTAKKWQEKAKLLGIVLGVFVLSTIPFTFNFDSFVSGLGVNCPPANMVNQKIGPFVFETADKCQKSPVWMMALLWGMGWYTGAWLLAKYKIIGDGEGGLVNRFLMILFAVAVGLVIFPEFLYFKDIYPAHFRSNTMFKLGYQAFIWWMIISAYVITHLYKKRQWLFVGTVAPLVLLVAIYPKFAVRSYFGELTRKNYKGIYGMKWMADQYPGDYAAIKYVVAETEGMENKPTIVEAVGDSYTDYARFSTFTGLPTIVGWPVHEWLWRGSYDVASPRIEEVRKIYESSDLLETEQILKKYEARYVVVGQLEKQKYPNLDMDKMAKLGAKVFEEAGTAIYFLAQ